MARFLGQIRQPQLEAVQLFLAEFAAPEFAEGAHPEKCEPHFFFEEGFDGRSDAQIFVQGCFHQCGGAGDVGQIK